MSKHNKTIIAWCIVAVLILIIVPLIMAKGAEFGGSDDAGGEAISEVQNEEYQPWFTPIMETFLGGELPGEIESLLFCLQTGIGVGVIFYFIGKFSERHKLVATREGQKQYQTYVKEYEESEKK